MSDFVKDYLSRFNALRLSRKECDALAKEAAVALHMTRAVINELGNGGTEEHPSAAAAATDDSQQGSEEPQVLDTSGPKGKRRVGCLPDLLNLQFGLFCMSIVFLCLAYLWAEQRSKS